MRRRSSPPACAATAKRNRRRAAPSSSATKPARSQPPRSRPEVSVKEPSAGIVAAATVVDKPRGRKGAAAQQQSLALGDSYALPPIDLLAAPNDAGRNQVDRAGLERNARLLESVLEDFHVRGDIVEVRPGPVVTMYELEPASGIKASRVIQLADDIARNMSALSARVATIPGRSVIGIELPNPKRESVVLRELIGSQAFADQAMSLPLVLGKNIAGDPVIADLAPMPHLLVAGTTGSGKSVGLNCMILSLLYRMGPDQCRMIMIDPKMLELSIYDGIPAPPGAGGDRAAQGDPCAEMGGRADGGALSDDGEPRRARAQELQRQGAGGQGPRDQARAQGADRLRRRLRASRSTRPRSWTTRSCRRSWWWSTSLPT